MTLQAELEIVNHIIVLRRRKTPIPMSTIPCEAQAINKFLQRASPQFISPTGFQWPYSTIDKNTDQLLVTPIACHLLEVRSPSKRNCPSHTVPIRLFRTLNRSVREQRRRVVQP